MIRTLLYTPLLRALLPAYLLRLWWRGRREPGYRQALRERVGLYGGQVMHGWVWIHAVSLGETRAAGALMAELRAQRPGVRILLTHGTATGREAGAALLQPGDAQAWLPYDMPGAVRRFIAHFRPAVGVLMETEVWPNLQHEARCAGLPMLLANARLSEKSLRKGRRLRGLMQPAAQSLTLALAQTPADAQRLREAGVAQVEVSGNLKFDMRPDAELLARGRAWRLASGCPVLLLASTREGEEAELLAAWCRLQSQRAARPVRLLLVPRHPQRFDEIARMVEAAGWTVSRRSAWAEGGPADQADPSVVWLGDSIGEMPAYYAAADVALLGGSFAPLGGQNLIESAACGCPLVMGPSTFNFAQAAELALEAGAARRVGDAAQGVDAALALIADEPARLSMVQAAQGFSTAHRGAAQRMAARVLEHARASAFS